MLKRSICVAVVAMVMSGVAQAVTTVSPGSAAGTEGDSNQGFPFNLPPFSRTAMRYQQVYASSDFTTLGGPELLTGMAFRIDEFSGAAFGPVTLSGYTIKFSTTSATVNTLSATYASNIGADETTVLSVPFTISGSNPAGSPKPFDITINFTTPFLYDPSAGNLLMEVFATQAFTTTQFDAVTSSTDSVARVFNTDDDPAATTGLLDSSGVVTQFQFQPVNTAVPEPVSATLALMGVAVLGLTALRRNRD